MSDSTLKRVSVRLNDGTEKFLKYTPNTLIEVEKELGVSPLYALSKEEHQGFILVRALIWAGMKGAGGKFGLVAVGNLMDAGEFKYYHSTAIKALQACKLLPEDKEAEEAAADPTPAPEDEAQNAP